MSRAADHAEAIRNLNDAFRRTFSGGRVMVTAGVVALCNEQPGAWSDILCRIKTYDHFTPDNDPYKEHDFGAIDFGSERVFWKIDYYDKTLEAGSENPADASCTIRIMTVMLACEY